VSDALTSVDAPDKYASEDSILVEVAHTDSHSAGGVKSSGYAEYVQLFVFSRTRSVGSLEIVSLLSVTGIEDCGTKRFAKLQSLVVLERLGCPLEVAFRSAFWMWRFCIIKNLSRRSLIKDNAGIHALSLSATARFCQPQCQLSKPTQRIGSVKSHLFHEKIRQQLLSHMHFGERLEQG
jgi:hypothetical protein